MKQRNIPFVVCAKNATCFARFYRSTRAKGMRNLCIYINREFHDRPCTCDSVIEAHWHESAWYFYKLPIIDRGQANCFQRGRRAGLSLTCPICTSNGNCCGRCSSSSSEKAERTKRSFVCSDNPRIYMWYSSTRAYIYVHTEIAHFLYTNPLTTLCMCENLISHVIILHLFKK